MASLAGPVGKNESGSSPLNHVLFPTIDSNCYAYFADDKFVFLGEERFLRWVAALSEGLLAFVHKSS